MIVWTGDRSRTAPTSTNGVLVFYGTQYTARPWRMIRLISNLLQHRQESRLDKSLQDLAHRMRNRQRPGPTAKRAPAAG